MQKQKKTKTKIENMPQTLFFILLKKNKCI